jgi:hypothetical protein
VIAFVLSGGGGLSAIQAGFPAGEPCHHCGHPSVVAEVSASPEEVVPLPSDLDVA